MNTPVEELEQAINMLRGAYAAVCHNCESGFASDAVVYRPEPFDKPADANLLVCCSEPIRDVVTDS